MNQLTGLKEEVIINVLGPGRCLGERALLTVEGRSCGAKALTDLYLMKLEK